ncbi:MAG: transporter substrate-binding domain-containing protein [Pseudomonadota bacterium]
MILRARAVSFGILLFLTAITARASESQTPQTLVVVTNDYPPYTIAGADNSFLPDLFAEIGDRMGVRFEIRFMPWRRGEQAVATGHAWGTFPYTPNEDRRKIHDFSETIYFADAHFFTYDPDGTRPPILYEKLEDLKGLRMGGIYGYYYEHWFEQAGLDTDFAHSEEQNLRRLQLGRIDLAPLSTTLGWYLIGQIFPPDIAARFKTVEKPLIDGGSLHLMTARNYPQNDRLLARFNRALDAVKKDGTYARLVEKHGLLLRY